MRLGNAFPPRFVFFMNIFIVLLCHSWIDRSPICTSKTAHLENFTWSQIRSKLWIIFKYNLAIFIFLRFFWTFYFFTFFFLALGFLIFFRLISFWFFTLNIFLILCFGYFFFLAFFFQYDILHVYFRIFAFWFSLSNFFSEWRDELEPSSVVFVILNILTFISYSFQSRCEKRLTPLISRCLRELHNHIFPDLSTCGPVTFR